MKPSIVRAAGAALAATLAVAGCSLQPRHPHPRALDAEGLHTRPLLTVREGVISVAPEPIVVSIRDLKQRKEAIVWRLPAGYRFQKQGIEVLGVLPLTPEAVKNMALRPDPAGRAAFDCQPDSQDQQAFACRPTDRAVKGVYRYVIRVLDPSGKPIDWDPSVFAMD